MRWACSSAAAAVVVPASPLLAVAGVPSGHCTPQAAVVRRSAGREHGAGGGRCARHDRPGRMTGRRDGEQGRRRGGRAEVGVQSAMWLAKGISAWGWAGGAGLRKTAPAPQEPATNTTPASQ